MAIITHLVVEECGAFISKHQGRLQVKKEKEVLQQAPLMHLEQVIVTGKAVGFSSDAVMACAEQGIPIYFLDFQGSPYASLYASGLTETVKTRRAQLLADADERGLKLGVAFASAKIKNQAALLRYRAKYRKEKDPQIYEDLRLLALEILDHLEELGKLEQAYHTIDQARAQLLGSEGRAAQKYWSGVRLLVNDAQDWAGRTGRGAIDPLNCALNYGYGILYGQIERAIVLAGLDPYAGFVHVDRPGKPSLVLDLIEEFRQPVVDRAIFALFNQGSAVKLDEEHLLTAESRKLIAEKVLERLEKPEKYEDKQHPLRSIIQHQARHLAVFLRGERETYAGFEVKW